MKRGRPKITDAEREARAIRHRQLRDESLKEGKLRFIQEIQPKLEKLHGLWKAAGFPFISGKTYQPAAVWQVNGVPGGLSLFCCHFRQTIITLETYHRLVMSESGAGLHYIKETPHSCHPRWNIELDEVYEVLFELNYPDELEKNLDKLTEILTSLAQLNAGTEDVRSQ